MAGEIVRAGDREGRPYGCVTRSAVRRADVGIGPYGCVTRSAAGRADVGIGSYEVQQETLRAGR